MPTDQEEYRKQNDLVRAQLEEVKANVETYLDKDQMPHEWGSIDSLDDMRNSMDIAVALMIDCDVGLMPKVKPILEEYGVCAAAEPVIEAAKAEGYR